MCVRTKMNRKRIILNFAVIYGDRKFQAEIYLNQILISFVFGCALSAVLSSGSSIIGTVPARHYCKLPLSQGVTSTAYWKTLVTNS